MDVDLKTPVPLVSLAELDAAGIAAWTAGDRELAAGIAIIAIARQQGLGVVTAERISAALKAALATIGA
jgi:hypothetical protein